jgi:hypothetical protein
MLGVKSSWLLRNDLTSPIPKSVHGPQERQLRDEETIEPEEQFGATFRVIGFQVRALPGADQVPEPITANLFLKN